MKNFYRLKTIGADVIMPIIMFELNERKKSGVDVDIAEAYVLLNDTQALYLAIAENKRNRATGYYAEVEPNIRALLRKYKLQWTLDKAQLHDYAVNYLVARQFRLIAGNVYEHPSSYFRATNYDMILMRAIITQEGIEKEMVESGIIQIMKVEDGENPQL